MNPTSLHCYRPARPVSDCDATIVAKLRASIKAIRKARKAQKSNRSTNR